MIDKYERLFRRLLEYVKKAQDYCEDITFDEFKANSMLMEACAYNICEIGHLVRPYVEELQALRPDIEWQGWCNLHYWLKSEHGDFLDYYAVWDVIQRSLSALQEKLEREMV